MNLVKILFILAIFSVSSYAQKLIDSQSATKEREKGFYYYDDYSDDNSTKPKKKKVPASPAQQMQGELTEELIKQMKINNKLQEKILKRLLYAFPDTIPEFTINKKTGKKCKSNSSADCFVMPVITEAQNSVPVMAKMLKNPTAENVKNYLEWQSVYLNHSFKIGQGFSLVSKQYEREINKMDGMSHTQRPLDGNKQNEIAYLKKSLIVKKLGKKLGLMVFIGKSKELERNFAGHEYTALLNSQFGNMENIVYVYNSQKDREHVEKIIASFGPKNNGFKKYSKVRVIVDPKQFDRFKINATPSAVLLYTKDDGSIIWQKAGYAIDPQALLTTTYRFLQFNNIIKPGIINEKDGWEMVDDLRIDKKFKAKHENAIQFDESNIQLSDDQYLKKSDKGKK